MQNLSDYPAYFTGSDNTDRFAVHIKTYKSVQIKIYLHDPIMRTDQFSVKGQHDRYRKLGNGVGRLLG